ncbi:ankyrin repeat and SOCS box protein 8-like [Haemaphysalis longicornis]
MWYLMEHVQRSYTLSERLLRAIGVGGTRQEDIEQLIRQGADVNQAHGTFLPLHCACMMGDASSVAVLLKWGADVNRFDGYHRTALHHAAEHSASCTSLLLAAGAETENVDTNGNTALHWAAFRNRADCCRLLLEHGADADCTDFNHDTPLSWAAMKVGPLWALSLEEPWHPGDFRLIDPLEGTPLGSHQPGHYPCVQVLLEHNASPDVRNCAGLVPLSRLALLLAAGLEVDERAFELLLRSMGSVEVRDREGRLPPLLARDKRMRTRLLNLCTTPRPLAQLGRSAVRRCLGPCHLPSAVSALPVPERLQRFLLLEEAA